MLLMTELGIWFKPICWIATLFCILELKRQPKVPIDMRKSKKSQLSPEPLDRRYDVEPESSVDVAALETFPYEFKGKDIVVNIDTDEFTAVCPWSGLPDFATIRIDYTPDASIVELRSLKYYLLSYRNVGIYQEHVVNKILDDLVKCAKPKWMKVYADYKVRGGIHTVASREYRRGSEKSR